MAKSKLAKLIPIEESEVIVEKKSLTESMNAINRKMKLGKFSKVKCASDLKSPEVIPTGIIGLDYSLKIGGFPRGRVVQIYGAESSWKTTIALRTCAESQRRGGKVLWVDAENQFNPDWATANGVDLDTIGVMQPDNQLEALDTITAAIEDGQFDIVVLDSLVALGTKKETEDTSLEVNDMGTFPKKMSQWFRSNIKYINRYGVLFIIINQLRKNITGYGNPETVPGGEAIKYYSSINIGIKKLTAKDEQILDSQGNTIGAKYQYIINKTRFDMFGKTGKFTAYSNIVDNYSMIKDIGLKEGFIKKLNTGWFEFNGEKIHGEEKIKFALAKDKNVYADLENKVRAKMGFNITAFNPYSVEEEPIEETDEDTINVEG